VAPVSREFMPFAASIDFLADLTQDVDIAAAHSTHEVRAGESADTWPGRPLTIRSTTCAGC
jgi:hypothetical protein